jgi:hypothetical protein
MYLDKELLFSDQQAVTADANSTNVIDLETVRDIGRGEPLKLFVQVDETMDDSGDDSTLAVKLVTDDNAALSSATVIRTLVTFAALTAAGVTHYFTLEPGDVVAFEQYLGIQFVTANGNLSAGKFTVGIVRDAQTAPVFPASGFSIT